MTTILIVEDDLSLQETLAYNLKRQEYTVEAVGDGQAAIATARKLYPNLDMILLDLMLPKVDGFEVCKILRQEMNIPIIMLTARDDEIDRVLGLEIGADDYISKPFSMRELLARIKAHLRRERLIREKIELEPTAKTHQLMTYDNLVIDLTRRELLLDGKPVLLKPKELDLLIFLAGHQGQALSRETILEHVWDWKYSGNTRTVDVHVRWLREKIEKDPANPTRIVTARGSGYRFEG
jgi:DNA-binding response OmpR family regulator